MSDEQTDPRDDKEDVEGHKFATEEPSEDDPGKMKMRMKTKTKTRASDDLGGEESGDRAKY